MESMAWQCQLMMNVLHCALHRWNWTVADILQSDIYTKFKVFIHFVTCAFVLCLSVLSASSF